MADLKEKIEKATNFVIEKVAESSLSAESRPSGRGRGDIQPQIGIILGTGLGPLAERIEERQAIPYGDIPFFPVPTIEWHKGELVFGKIGGKK